MYKYEIKRSPANIGILLFNEVEVLDFAGAFEVFSLAENKGAHAFNVFTVGETGELISARNGLKVLPHYSFSNHPPIDILLIPGGYGAEHIEIRNAVVLEWIRHCYSEAALTASICTGAFLLAEAGLLKAIAATTHWMDYDRLSTEYPEVDVIRDVKFVDQGRIMTAGGISAGINLCLHIVGRLLGIDAAYQIARKMEFDADFKSL